MSRNNTIQFAFVRRRCCLRIRNRIFKSHLDQFKVQIAIYACQVVLDTKYYFEQIPLSVCFVHLRITICVRNGNIIPLRKLLSRTKLSSHMI